MNYSIEADNYWSYNFCEDCDKEESPACKDYDDFYEAVSDYTEAIKNNCDICIALLKDTLSSDFSYFIEKGKNDKEYMDMVEDGWFGARLVLRDNESGFPIAYCNRSYNFNNDSLSDFDELIIDSSLLSTEQKEFFKSRVPENIETKFE